MNDTSTVTPSPTRLVIRRTFAAPLARVYDSWTQIDRLREWFCPPEVTVAIHEFDFRVGGAYRMEMRYVGGEGEVIVVGGVYREIVDRKRLVFTWRWEEDLAEDEFDTLVTVEFARRGSSTEMLFVHEQLKNEDSRSNHERGWSATFEKLATYLAR